MAIDRDGITNRIVSQLPSMGIQTKIDGDDSHTVKLVRAIVNEIVNEIISNGEVNIINIQTQGIGNMGSPVISQLVRDTGKGKIR